MPQITITVSPEQGLALALLSNGQVGDFAARQVTAVADTLVDALRGAEVAARLRDNQPPPTSTFDALLRGALNNRLRLTVLENLTMPALDIVRRAMTGLVSSTYRSRRQAPITVKGRTFHADDEAVANMGAALAALSGKQTRNWFDVNRDVVSMNAAGFRAVLHAVEARKQRLYEAKLAHEATIAAVTTADELMVTVFTWPEV